MNHPHSSASAEPDSQLKREVGLLGAVLMGLGSIVGTGVFVSVAIATGVTGPSVVLAIGLAALVAMANGLSSAQLAAAYSVSGGTYEYAYRLLNPTLGFTAGWMFLCAKSASAATAALGLTGACCHLLGIPATELRVLMAVIVVISLAVLVMAGIRRSNQSNTIIVCITLASLLAFVLTGLPTAMKQVSESFVPFCAPIGENHLAWTGFLQATALMFVAYTGYGRIATLAEEVREPRKTIPAAIIITLFASMVIYGAVGFVGVAAVGAARFAEAGTSQLAPLQVVARSLDNPGVANLLAIGAITAMLGVCLNLILGLSRVVLAMARRSDIPQYFAEVRVSTGSPSRATWLVALLICGLVLVGDVKTTWSFSAFTVLIYYAITNLAAIRLPREHRLYPISVAWFGLASCMGLAFWVEWRVWLVGLLLIAAGLAWHRIARLYSPSSLPPH